MEGQAITPAERISHGIASQTRDAIRGPDIAQTVIAAIALVWGIFLLFGVEGPTRRGGMKTGIARGGGGKKRMTGRG